MYLSLIRVSGNNKTGPIPVSMSSSDTCPTSCPWNGNGCYAQYFRTAIQWRQLDSGGGNKITAITWEEFLSKIAWLPKGQLWRHNVTGDLPGLGDTIDHHKLSELVEANRGRKGFTYTHKPVGLTGQHLVNARAIYAANKNGFSIGLSADGLKEADELADLNIAPVVAVIPTDSPIHMDTPGGRKAIVCPAEYNEQIQCANCQLCAKPRKAIVCFRAHGSGKSIVNKALKVIQ